MKKISPIDNAGNVALNSPVMIAFTKRIDVATANASTLFLTKGWDEPVAQSLSFTDDGLLATVRSQETLAPGADYTIHFTADIRDMVGYPIENPGSAHFVTGAELDTTPPGIITISPANGARAVPLNASVTIRFSEPLDQTSVDGNSVIVSHDGVPIAGNLGIEEDGSLVRFNLADSVAFEPDAFHQVTLTTSILDTAGNHLARDHITGFTTTDPPDTTPPRLVSIFPPDGSKDVSPDVQIEATFSEPIDPTTVSDSTFQVMRQDMYYLAFNEYSEDLEPSARLLFAATIPSYPVSGKLTISQDGKKVVFTPDYPLWAGRWQYYISIADVADLAGNYLEGGFGSGFVTKISSGTSWDALPASATISVDPSTLVPDGSSEAAVEITDILDDTGNTVADGTAIAVTAGAVYAVASAGGEILGGTESASYPGFKFFATSGGAVSLAYRAPDLPDLAAGGGRSAKIQVYSVDTGGFLVKRLPDMGAVTLSK